MPKYNVEVKPTTYKAIEADEAFDLAFQQQQSDMAAKLSGRKKADITHLNVFALGKNGKMTQLHDPEVYFEHKIPWANMAKAAHANCLFVRDKDGALRQIGLEHENGVINLTVSDPIKDNPPANSPSLWTYIKAFFNNKEAKETVTAYRFNKAFRALAGNADYNIKLNPDMIKIEEPKTEEQKIENPMPEKKVKAQVNEEEWERNILNELNREEMPDIRNMSVEEFYAHLDGVRSAPQSKGFSFPVVVGQPNTTPVDYYKFMTRVLVRNVAEGMYHEAEQITDSAKRNEFLDKSKDLFTSMTAGLRSYVVKHTDHNAVRDFFANRGEADAFSNLFNITRELDRNGVNHYMKEVQVQNVAAKQAQQPAAQVQQVQMEQPKMEAPTKGGHTL